MPHLSIYAPVDTTGFNNRSVQLMKKYKDLNFVKRAVNPTLQKLTLPDPDNPKGYMSHKMSYAEHDGQNFAFPGVVQDKGKLKYLPGIKGAKYAIQHKQLIPLGKDNNFADYFTTVGYKYNMNPDVYNEAMQIILQLNQVFLNSLLHLNLLFLLSLLNIKKVVKLKTESKVQ